jgi:hypothetical protein
MKDDLVRIDVIKGVEGIAIYLDDHRSDVLTALKIKVE